MAGLSLNAEQILECVQFRYPYLFIDYVENIVPFERSSGYKNLTINEWFFPVHFPTHPCMPGNLIAEAMGQMLGLTVLGDEEYKGKALILVATDKMRFIKQVQPGDKLDIVANVVSFKRGLLKGHCEARVRENLVAMADITLAITDELLNPNKVGSINS